MNERKGACCNNTTTIYLRVANFEKREVWGLEERPQTETRGVEHEKNHNSRESKKESKEIDN
jgi:hypothetical protein